MTLVSDVINADDSLRIIVNDEQAMLRFGVQLAEALSDDMIKTCVIFLHGELGAGKTTLSRGTLKALGVKGHVKSPTYTLVETYQLKNRTAFHFDLYRLTDPEELEFMGIRDYDSTNREDKPGDILLVEWPEQGQGFLPQADLQIVLEYQGQHRKLSLRADSLTGKSVLEKLVKQTI